MLCDTHLTLSRIRIDDDGVSWDKQEIDSQSVHRLSKLLWPTSMAQSGLVFGKTIVWHQINDLKTALGFRSTTTPLPSQSTEQQNVPLQGGGAGRGFPSPTARQTAEAPTAERTASTDDKAAPGGEASEKATPFSNELSRDEDKYTVPFPGSIRRSVHSSLPEFWKKFTQTWKPTAGLPPRGSFMLSGLVELEGPRAVMVIDVRAWWNPATKNFDNQSMVLNLRSFQTKTQSPLR